MEKFPKFCEQKGTKNKQKQTYSNATITGVGRDVGLQTI